MKPPTIYQLSATAVGITLSLFAMGDAEAYTFSRIFDDSGPYNFDDYSFYSSTPAINNQGTVAFEARLDLDQDPLPSHHDDRLYRDIIFSSNGQSLNPITQDMGFFEFKDINDSNTVAFSTQISSPRRPVYDLLTTNSAMLTTISRDQTNLGLGSDTFGDVVINNKGSAAFVQLDFDRNTLVTSIVISDGVNRTAIAESGSFFSAKSFDERLALNNKGNVAFEAFFDIGDSGIFIGNGDSTTRIADTNGLFSNFAHLSLNDSDTIAFAAALDDGSEGIFTSNGGSFTTIADTSGAFSSFSETLVRGKGNGVAINNNGTVAFGAKLDTGEYGIFTGSDPIADKIIAVGDSLFGSTVTSLDFSTKGFNDAGQVAFLAQLADGTRGIFRGDPESVKPEPVPEPSTGLGLLVISTIGAGSALRHKQK